MWEVAAQLTGLAASVLILRGIETSHTPSLVLPAWAAAQSAHVLLRLRSLRTLQFSFLNQKRACAAVTAYVRGQQVPSEWLGPALACPASVCKHCTSLRLVPEGMQWQLLRFGCIGAVELAFAQH